MGFDWREFLSLAQRLKDDTPPGMTREGACRCAMSRAYYAAFCYARNYARDNLDFEPRYGPEDHGRLRAHLKGKRRQKTSENLDRPREWRNACDYNDEIEDDLRDKLSAALEEARYVFDSLPPPSVAPSPEGGAY
jgi:hypothetical protein